MSGREILQLKSRQDIKNKTKFLNRNRTLDVATICYLSCSFLKQKFLSHAKKFENVTYTQEKKTVQNKFLKCHNK